MSEKLNRARAWQREKLDGADVGCQPLYHVTGGVGWINDPNGFSVYQGQYHLFFQYHPYSNLWGPMHWGHVRTRDFVRWERLPVALAPDRDYDRDGCFSGSAVELPDGRQMLMYTGVRKDEEGREWQTQCLAVGDGVDYEKYDGNPVLDDRDVPPGGSTVDFRDPRIWREGDRFLAVAGDRTEDGSGSILLYESEDAFHWRYAGIVDRSGNAYGKMWECPDLFRLDGKWVLLTSPQEMRADPGGEFHDGYGTLCIIGALDGARGLLREHIQAIDCGLDFYAPQTLETPEGRRIMIAWMQDWDTATYLPEDLALPYHCMMTFPRELRLENGRLYQTPVRELEAFRGEAVLCRAVTASEPLALPGVTGRAADLTVTVFPAGGENPCRSFTLELARGGSWGITLRWECAAGTLCLDRSAGGFPGDCVNRRSFPVTPREGGSLKMRILLDRWSAETFVNDGQRSASCVFYIPPEAEGIRFSSEGEARAEVEFYPLKF